MTKLTLITMKLTVNENTFFVGELEPPKSQPTDTTPTTVTTEVYTILRLYSA